MKFYPSELSMLPSDTIAIDLPLSVIVSASYALDLISSQMAPTPGE